jgi:diketogulonate reductase-like aldo/keto reductase
VYDAALLSSTNATCAAYYQQLTLSNGVIVPAVGFGTAGLVGDTQRASALALDAGFRHFDSAQATEWYDERALGYALLSRPEVKRENLFLTSKLHPKDHGAPDPLGPSLAQLGTDYLDLFLLHYPRCWDGVERCRGAHVVGTWHDSWRLLEAEYDAGRVRAIGVSNFGLDELQELYTMARVKPHVVQNWLDPLHQDRAVRAFCRAWDIKFVAFSSLGTQWEHRLPGQRNPVLGNDVLRAIAARHSRTVVAVVMSWVLAGGEGVIPRSANPVHIADNAGVLNATVPLTKEDLAAIDALIVE